MDSRPSVYTEGTSVVFRASSFGLPLRSLVAARLGYEPQSPPDIVRTAGNEGTRLEGEIKLSLGVPVVRDQSQVEFRHHHVIVRGHIDGIVPGRVLEVKTVSAAGMEAWIRDRWDARPGWAWQVSPYCHAEELPLLMVVRCRDTGEQDRWETDPPHSPDEVRQRIDTVEHFVGLKELPPANPGHPGWDPWQYLHRAPTTHDPELGPVMRELYLLTSPERNARVDALKRELVFLMGDRQKVRADGVEASLSRSGALTLRSV